MAGGWGQEGQMLSLPNPCPQGTSLLLPSLDNELLGSEAIPAAPLPPSSVV